MRLGDYIVATSFALNLCAVLGYAWQGHWRNSLYFASAAIINGSLIGMR